jgi:phospholipase C
VAGDLTSIFNFATPNDHKVKLPSTVGYIPPDLLPHDSIAVTPNNIVMGVPNQELGTRPARALPYELNVYGAARFNDKSMRLVFENTGDAAAVFHVRSGNPLDLPRSYTVEANKSLGDAWTVKESYDLSVYGPNGFFRSFKGSVAAHTMRARLDVRASYNTSDQGVVTLRIVNSGEHTAKVSVVDAYTGKERNELLAPHEDMDHDWSLDSTHGWYDLIVRVAADDAFEYRLAGHVETGRDSMSDPALGGLQLKV